MAKKEKRVDVPNQGHRHLFGTTEKSDFILNMDYDGAQRMCSRFCMLAMAIVTLVLIPAYYTQKVELYVEEGMMHYLSDNFIFYAASMVMLAGGVGYLVFNVARQKGLVDIKRNKLLVLPLLVLLATLVSSLAAARNASLHDSILGYMGRHDGFLMTLGCFGLFAVAAALSDSGNKKKLADFIVGVGTLQSVVGILEAVPATAGAFSNFFDRLFLRPGSEISVNADAGEFYVPAEEFRTAYGIYKDGKVASGYLTSPHALIVIIAVAFAIALAGAAFDENKKRRILYCIAAPIMAAAACLAEVWAGVICIAAGALFVTVFAVIKAAKGSKGALAVIIPVVCSGIAAGVLFGTGAAHFEDEHIIFTDSYVNRMLGFDTRYDYRMGITDKTADDTSIYSYLMGDGENLIMAEPVFGVGPDCALYYLQDHSLTLDRSYNEYVDTAAQKGIITLVLYGIFLLVTVIKGFGLFSKFIKGKGDWVSAAALAAVIAYLIQAWFNTTWFSATYVFFIAAGLCWDLSSGASGKKTSK